MPSSDMKKAWWTLLGICLVFFAVAYATTALATMLNALGEDLNASFSTLQWSVNIYSLVAASLIVPFGRLSDILGFRKLLLCGLFILSVGFLVSAVATESWCFLLGRTVQALGSALFFPSAMSLIVFLFPKKYRKKAFSLWSASAGLGIAIGPFVGGFVSHTLGWRYVFLSTLPFMAVSMFILWLMVPAANPVKAHRSLNFAGAAFFAMTLCSLLLFFEEGRFLELESMFSLCLIALFFVCALTFFVLEWKFKNPLLSISNFRVPNFSIGIVSLVVANFCVWTVLFLGNLFVQNHYILDFDPLAAGLEILPFTMIYFLVSLFVGRLRENFSSRMMITIGLFLVSAGTFSLSLLESDFTYVDLWTPFLALGVGSALCRATARPFAVTSVSRNNSGEASALTGVSLYVGAILGVATSGAIYRSHSLADFKKTIAHLNLGDGEKSALDGFVSGLSTNAKILLARAGPKQLEQLQNDAKEALIAGFSASMMVASILAFLGALMVFSLVKGKKKTPKHASGQTH